VKKVSEWCFTFGESQMINRHILEHHILKLETNLVEIFQMKMVTQELLLLIKEKQSPAKS
jgi:hypothetical protein